jgi:transcriptional regulator with XRE-family HTH domain
MTLAPTEESAGTLLRTWRERRRLSQLDLSNRAAVSTRHLSYVETGRSRPSRELLLHLAETLDVPLREQNRMLLAAGHAPHFSERPVDAPELAEVRRALDQVLEAHDPWPAVLVDGHWDVVGMNAGAWLFADGVDPSLLEPPINVIRLSLHPDGLARRVVNFAEFARHLLVLPVVLRSPVGELRLFSTIATFGAPLDATLSELALEAFYPSDTTTAERMQVLRSQAN